MSWEDLPDLEPINVDELVNAIKEYAEDQEKQLKELDERISALEKRKV